MVFSLTRRGKRKLFQRAWESTGDLEKGKMKNLRREIEILFSPCPRCRKSSKVPKNKKRKDIYKKSILRPPRLPNPAPSRVTSVEDKDRNL